MITSESQKLKKLIIEYPYCWRDKSKFRGLIKDYLPGEKALCNLLLISCDEGIPDEIVGTSLEKTEISRLKKRILSASGCSESMATKLIKLWCELLELVELSKWRATFSNPLEVSLCKLGFTESECQYLNSIGIKSLLDLDLLTTNDVVFLSKKINRIEDICKHSNKIYDIKSKDVLNVEKYCEDDIEAILKKIDIKDNLQIEQFVKELKKKVFPHIGWPEDEDVTTISQLLKAKTYDVAIYVHSRSCLEALLRQLINAGIPYSYVRPFLVDIVRIRLDYIPGVKGGSFCSIDYSWLKAILHNQALCHKFACLFNNQSLSVFDYSVQEIKDYCNLSDSEWSEFITEIRRVRPLVLFVDEERYVLECLFTKSFYDLAIDEPWCDKLRKNSIHSLSDCYFSSNFNNSIFYDMDTVIDIIRVYSEKGMPEYCLAWLANRINDKKIYDELKKMELKDIEISDLPENVELKDSLNNIDVFTMYDISKYPKIYWAMFCEDVFGEDGFDYFKDWEKQFEFCYEPVTREMLDAIKVYALYGSSTIYFCQSQIKERRIKTVGQFLALKKTELMKMGLDDEKIDNVIEHCLSMDIPEELISFAN